MNMKMTLRFIGPEKETVEGIQMESTFSSIHTDSEQSERRRRILNKVMKNKLKILKNIK
jgi:hypothetical protein